METKLNCDGAVESELVPVRLAMMEGVPFYAACFFKIGEKWYCVFGDFKNTRESPYGYGATFEEALAKLQAEVRLKALKHVAEKYPTEESYIYLTQEEIFRKGDQAIEIGSPKWFEIYDSVGKNLLNRPRWAAARRKVYHLADKQNDGLTDTGQT